MDPPDALPPGGIAPGSSGDYLTPEPNSMVDGVDVKIHNRPAGSPDGTPLHDSNESRFARLTNALLDEQLEHRSCRARLNMVEQKLTEAQGTIFSLQTEVASLEHEAAKRTARPGSSPKRAGGLDGIEEGSEEGSAIGALAEEVHLSNKEWTRLTHYRQAESLRARPVTTSHPSPTPAIPRDRGYRP